jgi:hypothetical protein
VDQGAAGDPGHGIWGIVAVFVLLAGVGLALLLFGPDSGGDSVQLDTPQTLPEGDGRSDGAASVGGVPDSGSIRVGSPEGVDEDPLTVLDSEGPLPGPAAGPGAVP